MTSAGGKQRHDDIRRLTAVAAATVVALATVLAGINVLFDPADGRVDTAAVTQDEPTPGTQAVHGRSDNRPSALPPSAPAALTIPAIGVATSALIDLGFTHTGAIEIPGEARAVGWLSSTPTPGERGAAVFVGNAEFGYQSGAFFRLHELDRGDTITVDRRDGVTAVFTVYRVGSRPRHGDTAQLTRPSKAPEVRLTTCGGHFDDGTTGHAEDVVVYARLTATR
ncbi:sortase domain-containing protein [Amycolatopsis cihanbeyliensis]|uniref:Sortase family protein n=1 Tax=Amycolatopsis cihanbeyliensis TaxID=1128664 RepID=A0A542DFK5_AMYCI|nr:sortase [Amycolatopsis cihanbeyliensis]TQJ01878.1 sortase family protein [Amycolatopsis cihanbeyliensis]